MTRWMTPRVLPVLALAAGLVIGTGCGGKNQKDAADKTVVTGKLVENGRPFALDVSKVPLPKGAHALPPGISGALAVTFISSDTKETFDAEVNSDAGTFQVKGPDGKGIKPGRYRIAVTGRLGIGDETPDYFKGMFTPEKTQILRDVKPGDDIVIDVAKPQG